MKVRLLFLLLTGFLTGACRSDTDIGPADLLYKRWHVSQFKLVGENTWMTYDTDGLYDTEYQANGALIYRRNGVVTQSGCCVPNRFERDGAQILYSDFPSCPAVKCAGYPNATIMILKENLLELQAGDQITQYTPAN